MKLLVPILLLAADLTALDAQVPDQSAMSQISIVSPVDGMVFKARANIRVEIAGIDVPNTGHVIRLLEGEKMLWAIVLDPLVPTMNNPVPFNFDFDWNDVRAGRYTLTAMIDDISSEPLTVVVKKKRSGRH